MNRTFIRSCHVSVFLVANCLLKADVIHIYPVKSSFLKYVLFCDITHHMEVIYYRRFGTTYRSNVTGYMKMEPIGCPKNSVRNYTNRLFHISEECRFQLFREGSPKISFLLKVTRLILLPQTLYHSLYNIKNSVIRVFTFYDTRYSFFFYHF